MFIKNNSALVNSKNQGPLSDALAPITRRALLRLPLPTSPSITHHGPCSDNKSAAVGRLAALHTQFHARQPCPLYAERVAGMPFNGAAAGAGPSSLSRECLAQLRPARQTELEEVPPPPLRLAP